MTNENEELVIINEIMEKASLNDEELEDLISEKIEEYKGMIVRKVALNFIHDELGLNKPKKPKKGEKPKMEKKEKGTEIVKPSKIIEEDKKWALTTHDENEAIPVKNVIAITHYPTKEEVLFLIERRKFVKEKLIDDSDKMNIAGQLFLKKSAWRKYINAFGISIDIISKSVYKTEDDTIAEYVVKAIVPGGQYVVAEGTKSKSEYWSEKYQNFGSYTIHNLKATARTRAINIAVSDLVGYGETSAEELSEKELKKAKK